MAATIRPRSTKCWRSTRSGARLETALQQCNADRKRLSKEIGGARSRGEDSAELEDRVRRIGDEIAELVRRTAEAEERQREFAAQHSQPAARQCAGRHDRGRQPRCAQLGRETDSCPARFWITLRSVRGCNLFDLERATKLSGSGFICFTGAGARLERALIQFMLDLHTREHGYLEVSPPFLVRRDCMIGTTQLPKFEEDMYGLEDGAMFLAPTAEVPVTNLHREEILAARSCQRNSPLTRPAFGAKPARPGGKLAGSSASISSTRWNWSKITTPENSDAEHEALTADAERVLQLLGLHYRVIELCTGDLGFGSAKTYDLEVWSPGPATDIWKFRAVRILRTSRRAA